jgi:hypothetical protein
MPHRLARRGQIVGLGGRARLGRACCHESVACERGYGSKMQTAMAGNRALQKLLRELPVPTQAKQRNSAERMKAYFQIRMSSAYSMSGTGSVCLNRGTQLPVPATRFATPRALLNSIAETSGFGPRDVAIPRTEPPNDESARESRQRILNRDRA